jgi:uncharacterized protein YjiS (DUF1127 family)
MDYETAAKHKETATLPARLRLMFWQIVSNRRRSSRLLDPRSLSDHILNDIGLERPNQPWDESVGFWRGN